MANALVKKDWISNFDIVGKAVVNDYTFKIEQRSEKSDWVYNSMNVGIDCGENHGTVYAELMGGYPEEREPFPIKVHGKDEKGRDDFDNRFEVAWEDRNDPDIMAEVGKMCFITVGLEKTTEDKTYYKNFLSAYDAIEYASKHLKSDMVVRVCGNLRYSMYNETVQVRKEISSIVLSSKEDYSATFMQTVLLDKDSASLKEIDKDKSVMYINARVLDYVKEYNGVEVKGMFPYAKQFEFKMDLTNPEKCKKLYDKLFKVKKGVTQATFEGAFVEGGATVEATLDDVPEDLKELIELGVLSEKEACQKCSTNGSRERRMLLTKPYVKKVIGDDDSVTPVIQIFTERYEEDDLILDCMVAKQDDDEDEELPFDTNESAEGGSTGDDSLDWLDQL